MVNVDVYRFNFGPRKQELGLKYCDDSLNVKWSNRQETAYGVFVTCNVLSHFPVKTQQQQKQMLKVFISQQLLLTHQGLKFHSNREEVC